MQINSANCSGSVKSSFVVSPRTGIAPDVTALSTSSLVYTVVLNLKKEIFRNKFPNGNIYHLYICTWMYPQLRKSSISLTGVPNPNRHMDDRCGGSNIIPWPETASGETARANRAEKMMSCMLVELLLASEELPNRASLVLLMWCVALSFLSNLTCIIYLFVFDFYHYTGECRCLPHPLFASHALVAVLEVSHCRAPCVLFLDG